VFKLFFVTSEFTRPDQKSTGGLGAYIWKMASTLASRGIKIHIVCAGPDTESVVLSENIWLHTLQIRPPSYKWYDKFIHQYTSYFKSYSWYYYKRLCQQSFQLNQFLLKLADNDPPDLIQYSNLAGLAFCRPLTIPSVIRLSSVTDLYASLGKGYYGISPMLYRAQIRIENKSYSKVDGVFGPTQSMLKHVLKSTYIHRILTPYFEYDFKNVELLNRKRPYLFFFGSIDYRKGVDMLLEVMKDDRFQDYDLILAGKIHTKTQVDSDLAVTLQASGPQIQYVGELEKNTLHAWILGASFVVLPSRVDNFPNTLVESIAAGKLVIGPDNWGFNELLKDGESGFLFQSGSTEDLKMKLLQAIHLSEEEKNQMVIKTSQILNKLDPQVIADELFKYYLQIIKKHQVCNRG
jgi:glycosyltransferase involved in cell wall biosynthesis